MYKVDARGEACPKPVLMTKAAVQNGEEEIQTLVDNPTAVQNLSRFAASVGYTHESQEDNGVYTVTLKKDPNADVQKAEAYEDRSWSIFCTENRIGSADNELGHNLIQKGFRPRPVDEQQIRPGQGDHIFRGELKVMKAAGLRLSQAFYRDALHPVGQVQRRHIYRIKGGHNPQIRLFFVGYPGEQGDNR